MKSQAAYIERLHGPIAIFGAGGFVGFNLLNAILDKRRDVLAISSNPKKNWRFQKRSPPAQNMIQCNLLEEQSIRQFVKKHKPKTIFNLAAYGGYPKQKDTAKIYQTNFNSTVNLIEELKKHSFFAYVHAGSQSEYGLNSSGPSEGGELIPNSHYAVSKTAVHYLLKYYGKIEKLPVIHLRFYSVYGPWEEPDRLIPTLIETAKNGGLPNFVAPNISRDFIYIDDVVEAMILVAAEIKLKYYGEAFNICTGKKTTIKELAYLAKKSFKIKTEPKFGSMKNRDWDVSNWYGNPKKIQKTFGWRVRITLKKGLLRFYHEK